MSFKSKMESDQQQNIKLVNEIENYPYIYNYTLPEYARRDVTEKAWIEIGNKVNLSGPECKEKWKNLRSVFARRLKRRKAGKTEKKPYYLAKYMQFTIPFLKMNSRVSEELPPCQQSEDMSDSEGEGKNCNETDEEDEVLFPTMGFHSILLPQPSPNSQSILPTAPSPNSSEEHSQHSKSQHVDSSEEHSQHSKTHIYLKKSSMSKKTVKRKINDISKLEEIPINNKVNRKSKKLKGNHLDRKSNKMFLLSLLADMDAMDDKQRRFFKQKMLEVVDEIFNMENSED